MYLLELGKKNDLHHGALGWSVVCDCGILRSHLLFYNKINGKHNKVKHLF